MVIVVDANEIARQTAAELASEFGPAIIHQTEQAIREPTRDWGIVLEGIRTAGDITHTVHFMMIIIPIAIARWQQLKDVKAVRVVLEAFAKERAIIKLETATKIIDAVLRIITRNR